MSVKQTRADEVAKMMRVVKSLCRGNDAITRNVLAAIEGELAKLAMRAELFPDEEFDIAPADRIKLFRLWEEADNSFALYFHRANPPAAVPPHNHTTWACIAGISGVEKNTLYDVAENAAPVAKGQKLITAGETISLLPEDVHAIEAQGDEPFANLHLYGLALDRLVDRVFWNEETMSWAPAEPVSGILERRA